MTQPSVSVVICSLNGAERIPATIDSLRQQNYPAQLMDLIVVDDGSTDETSAVARAMGARVLRHGTNRGIAAARNSGLNASDATIVGYLDDDVVAEPTWLSALLAVFADEGVFASGGRVLAAETSHISQRYLLAAGYGNPATPSARGSRTLGGRLITYVDSMFRPVHLVTTDTEVDAIYTSNVAYRRAALIAIGGFDESLLASEDTDISRRLRAAGGRIVFVPSAVIRHRHHTTMTSFVGQTFRRAASTLTAYRRAGLVPPVFPSPLVWAGLSVGLAAMSGVGPAIVGAAVSPQILYPWWPFSAVRRGEAERVIYPYIQLAIEAATVAGMARGLTRPAARR